MSNEIVRYYRLKLRRLQSEAKRLMTSSTGQGMSGWMFKSAIDVRRSEDMVDRGYRFLNDAMC